jgi:hypothetical protein
MISSTIDTDLATWWNRFFTNFPHGVLVIKDSTIVHAVGYPEPATRTDVDHLAQELREDPNLGLTDLVDYHITPVSGSDWHKYAMIYAGD